MGIYWEGKDEGVMEKFGGTNTHNEKGTKAICAEVTENQDGKTSLVQPVRAQGIGGADCSP